MAAGLTAPHLRLAAIAPLAASAEACLLPWLSSSERARLAAITSPRRRAEFLAGRLLLRQLLADTLGGTPADHPLSAPVDGPPRGTSGLHLALSHSQGWVAAGVAGVAVGLDVEAPGRPRDLRALAAEVFTDAEQARLAGLEGEALGMAFRETWTLKEAWVKREAGGITPGRLRQIDTRCGGADGRTWSSPALTVAWVGGGGWPGASGVALPGRETGWRIADAATLP